MKCSLCDSHLHFRVADTDSKSHKPLDIYLCETCGLIQQAPLPSERELRDYYSTSYRLDYKKTTQPKPKHVYRSARLARQRLNFLLEAGVRPSGLLDIGAGSGEFVALASQAGFQGAGIEPNHGYSDYARAEYGAGVTTGELSDAAGRHDVVTLFHVMEHLRNPVETFGKLHSLVRPGGWLFIEVPWALSGSIAPNNLYFKAHLYYFDLATLAAAASRHFDVVASEARGNLRVLFKPKDKPGAPTLPPADYAAWARQKLERYGWLDYLISGGGWRKPMLKWRQLMAERKVKALNGRQILAAFAHS